MNQLRWILNRVNTNAQPQYKYKCKCKYKSKTSTKMDFENINARLTRWLPTVQFCNKGYYAVLQIEPGCNVKEKNYTWHLNKAQKWECSISISTVDRDTTLHFLGAMSHETITVYILMYITSQHGCGTIVNGFNLYRLHRDTALHFLGAMSHDKPDSCPQMHICTLCSLLSEALCPEISKDAS